MGERIGTGRVRVVHDVKALDSVQPGEVLVAEMTDPDWEPVMRRVRRDRHRQRRPDRSCCDRLARIRPAVHRRHGPATRTLHDGDEVTVCCAEGAEGRVYAGRVPFRSTASMSPACPTRTRR